MNLNTTANAGAGLASLSIVGVAGILWALLLCTMVIALVMALSHFIPRKMMLDEARFQGANNNSRAHSYRRTVGGGGDALVRHWLWEGGEAGHAAH
jgi:hypothetical protein